MLSKQKRSMRHRTRKTHKVKVIHYDSCILFPKV